MELLFDLYFMVIEWLFIANNAKYTGGGDKEIKKSHYESVFFIRIVQKRVIFRFN
jgi:hypothetical protein